MPAHAYAVKNKNDTLSKETDFTLSDLTGERDEFNSTDETPAEILDGLIGQFQAIKAKFVSDYNNARTIIHTSASHTSFRGAFSTAGACPAIQFVSFVCFAVSSLARAARTSAP